MIEMREASQQDMSAVYRLSNEPSIRAASISSEPIPLSSHIEWYSRKLADQSLIFLLFFDKEKLIAQIRFELIEIDEAEVSISIDSGYRGRGIGKELLTRAQGFAINRWKLKTIKAIVKKENEVSQRFFKKCGYIFCGVEIIKSCVCAVFRFDCR